MFYNIYFLHACFILYNLPIFVLHNIVFNVLSDNKICCYKIVANCCCFIIMPRGWPGSLLKGVTVINFSAVKMGK